MFLMTTLAVFIVSCGVVPLMKWLFNDFTLVMPNIWIFLLDSLVTSILIVGILTWIFMPFLSQKIFSKWLYK